MKNLLETIFLIKTLIFYHLCNKKNSLLKKVEAFEYLNNVVCVGQRRNCIVYYCSCKRLVSFLSSSQTHVDNDHFIRISRIDLHLNIRGKNKSYYECSDKNLYRY